MAGASESVVGRWIDASVAEVDGVELDKGFITAYITSL